MRLDLLSIEFYGWGTWFLTIANLDNFQDFDGYLVLVGMNDGIVEWDFLFLRGIARWREFKRSRHG